MFKVYAGIKLKDKIYWFVKEKNYANKLKKDITFSKEQYYRRFIIKI